MSFIAGLGAPKRMGQAEALQEARNETYDFIVTALPHSSDASTARSDVIALESKWWSTSIVGAVVSPPPPNPHNKGNGSVYGTTLKKPLGGGGHDGDENSIMLEDGGDRRRSANADTANANALPYSCEKGQTLIETMCSPTTPPNEKRIAEEYFAFMLDWAGHMTIPAVILPAVPLHHDTPITTTTSASVLTTYGRFLATQCLKSSASNIQLWLRVPFTEQAIQQFCILHKLCDGPSNLGCMLEFNANPTPSFRSSTTASNHTTEQQTMDLGRKVKLLHQIIGCNLRAIVFDTRVFLTNKKGFPTLTKAHQVLFMELLKRLGRTCRILVEGRSEHGDGGHVHYLQYLRHLRSKKDVCQVLDTEESKMELNYLDHLQSALQPLGDNLEYSTYETFERDPVKYERYRRAVELALIDKKRSGELRKDSDSITHVLILVVGAGRGPLVQASLDAVANVNRETDDNSFITPKIIAVEKNPSAVLYLHSLKAKDIDWATSVDIAECDMRYADDHPLLSGVISGRDENKADIVVSELLGSFGDNELSPECLDGVQRCGLLKTTSISIPQKYTSYISPVTSMRLHSEAQAQAYTPSNALEGPGGKPCGLLHAMETPYVVRSHAAAQTHQEASCWEFSHPLKDVDNDGLCTAEVAKHVNNERCATVLFEPDTKKGAGYGGGYGQFNRSVDALASMCPGKIKDTTIHGFLGTFHCVLYEAQNETSIISIAPNSFSVGMFSWFPLYFPLKEPLLVPVDASIRCSVWRKSDSNGRNGSRVWYEWCVEILSGDSVLNVSSLHNPNGRSSHVRL